MGRYLALLEESDQTPPSPVLDQRGYEKNELNEKRVTTHLALTSGDRTSGYEKNELNEKSPDRPLRSTSDPGCRAYEKNELNELSPPADADADFEERAALVEEGSGVPREWAEGYARLCLMPPPRGIRQDQWFRCIDDAGRFIDQWAAPAHALGWDTEHVFGVHPSKPAQRFDAAGLVWLLQGSQVVAIAADRAEIRTPSGRRQTYTRRLHSTDAVSLWSLTLTEHIDG